MSSAAGRQQKGRGRRAQPRSSCARRPPPFRSRERTNKNTRPPTVKREATCTTAEQWCTRKAIQPMPNTKTQGREHRKQGEQGTNPKPQRRYSPHIHPTVKVTKRAGHQPQTSDEGLSAHSPNQKFQVVTTHSSRSQQKRRWRR